MAWRSARSVRHRTKRNKNSRWVGAYLATERGQCELAGSTPTALSAFWVDAYLMSAERPFRKKSTNALKQA